MGPDYTSCLLLYANIFPTVLLVKYNVYGFFLFKY